MRSKQVVSIAVIPALPIVSERRMVQEPPGDWTLADVVEAAGLDPEAVTVSLDGRVIEPHRLAAVYPGGGSSVIVAARPGLLNLAWLAAVAITSAGAASSAIVIAATFALAGLLVAGAIYGLAALSSALLSPSQHDAEAVPNGQRVSIAGGSNAFRAYAPVPQVLGRHRLYPPLAARGYTVVEGERLVQYALFTFGFGKLELSDLRIKDEPLFREDTTIVYTGKMKSDVGTFGGRVKNGVVVPGKLITLELRQGTPTDEAITLFSANVQETLVSLKLLKSKGWVRRTTLERATEITVIVGAPNGLFWVSGSGDVKTATLRIEVRYRAVGTEAWTDLTRIKMSGASRGSVYADRTWTVAEGTYEVEVRRQTAEGGLNVTDEAHWVSMLVHRAGTVVAPANLCLVAARIVLTDNLPGIVDEFNAVAQTVALDWNGATWAAAATSNPASLYRLVLQGAANLKAVADARIDLTALQAWHTECATNDFSFNHVTSGQSTVPDVLRMVAATGRASPGIRDGLFTVVRENDLSGAAVQHFTPRNVRSFTSTRQYVDRPEAFKVQFVDPESGWLDTERIVPDDGFTVATATTFERLDMPGITDSDLAYKIGRYHLAQLRLRPEEYVIETDFEHLDCVRGDWVKFNNDVILVGLAAGRVVSVTLNGSSDATAVVVDQECPMAAETYSMRFRKSDGSTVVAAVVTSAGNQTTLTFSTPIDSADPQPVAGDLFMFGESGLESIDLIVKSIEPLGELDARLTLVDAAPGVITALTGAIPAYSPQITLPPDLNPSAPASPRVLAVTSTDVRDEEGRGPVIRRGVRIRIQPRPWQLVASSARSARLR